MPLVTRDGTLVVEAIERAQGLFPWLLRGVDFDNDSAFMNEVVVPWCRGRKFEVTRSRAYKKNDQAFVEQKNGAVVRRIVGYRRLEGLAAAPAIEQRWGQPAHTLPANHAAWELEAHYLALAIANLTFVVSPQRIVLGGGVMHRSELYPMIRDKVAALLNGYADTPEIVPPQLGDRAGVLGAIALAGAAR